MNKVPAPGFLHRRIIGFSLAESEDLLELGFGPEHQREVILSIARGVLREGADLCYGGSLQSDGTFTLDLIDLSSAEQREAASPGNRASIRIGRLFNPITWPAYEQLTVAHEAQWIDCYTAVRVTREDAGIEPTPDDDAVEPTPLNPPVTDDEKQAEMERQERERLRAERRAVHVAAVLSRMRRTQIDGFSVPAPFGRRGKKKIEAAILLGGKVTNSKGLCPGLIEEGVNAMQKRIPVFLLGGFGGATRVLTDALEARNENARRKVLDDAFNRFEDSPRFTAITRGLEHCPLPEGIPSPAELRDEIGKFFTTQGANIEATLRNGLSAAENRILFRSTDPFEIARLILAGLREVHG